MMKKFNFSKRTYNILMFISFALFIILLIWVLYFKLNDFSSLMNNYIDYKDLSPLERALFNIKPTNPLKDKDFILNLLAFVPFGIYLPLIFKKHNLLKGVVICFLISLCFEIVQLFTLIGTFTTDDLIANSLGYLFGYLLYHLIIKKVSENLVNLANVIIITLASPIAIYAIINTALNFSFYVTKTL